MTSSVKSNGGPAIEVQSDPIKMQEAFTSWAKQLSKNEKLAQSQKMVWSNWFDLQDVQEAVNNLKDKSMQRKFTEEAPSTEII